MKIIIQRVAKASVDVDNVTVAKIDSGILALVCIEESDAEQVFKKAITKMLNYRIFEDENNKMNLSLVDKNAGLILVPQFTLLAETKKGSRPSFSNICPPDIAKQKFREFVSFSKSVYTNISAGMFGADMQVSLVNDGPVTFIFKV